MYFGNVTIPRTGDPPNLLMSSFTASKVEVHYSARARLFAARSPAGPNRKF